MQTINDRELGEITVSRTARSYQVRIKVAPDGRLRISAPKLMPLFMIKRAIDRSRHDLRVMVESQRPVLRYGNGSEIGKSHSLLVREGAPLSITRQGLRIIVTLPKGCHIEDHDVQEKLRKQVIAALRREAKGYLTKRLQFLADKSELSYAKVRFSHASSRWGSCSSNGTISLNIALMKLSFELIDYVLIHELAHTVHMNHSTDFWNLVEMHDPHFKAHRARLKQESPVV